MLGASCQWDLQEVKKLHGVGDAVPGAAFMCQLASSDQKRPLDFLTNIHSSQEKFFVGWPSLLLCGASLNYDGPLSQICPCIDRQETTNTARRTGTSVAHNFSRRMCAVHACRITSFLVPFGVGNNLDRDPLCHLRLLSLAEG